MMMTSRIAHESYTSYFQWGTVYICCTFDLGLGNVWCTYKYFENQNYSYSYDASTTNFYSQSAGCGPHKMLLGSFGISNFHFLLCLNMSGEIGLGDTSKTCMGYYCLCSVSDNFGIIWCTCQKRARRRSNKKYQRNCVIFVTQEQ